MTERFKYYPITQIIEDTQTRKRYYANKEIADLLNQLNNQLEQIPEKIKEVWIE